MEEKRLMTIKEASKYLSLTPQAISHAYEVMKLKGIQINNRKYFHPDDLEIYKKNKWSRDHHFNEKWMSVKEAAGLIHVTINRIYYLLHTGRVEYHKKGGLYMIDRQAFRQKYFL